MAISQADIIKMMQEFNENEANWAQHSQFYNKIMSDGNIFNPYLHRRFLPAQFDRLVKKTFGKGSTIVDKNAFIKNTQEACTPFHVIDSVTKEINLLAFLEDKDPIAFDERSMIMPLNQCKQAYIDLFQYLTSNCNINIWNATHLTDEMGQYQDAIANARSYTELDKILNTPWQTAMPGYGYGARKHVTAAKIYQAFWTHYHSDFSYVGCKKFYDMFLLSGAYYSLKNYYMFKGEIDNRREQLKALYDVTVKYRDWGRLINNYCSLVDINAAVLVEGQAA